MSRVKFSDRQQADLTEMKALADSAEDNGFGLVNALLFSSDYRVEGGIVSPDGPASGIVTIDPGVFVKADGKFYKMATEATANILTGTENQSANIWGTGQAAHATLPRKDIIVVSHQFVESDVQVKNFIDDSVTPPVQFTQNVTTRKNSTPLFAVLHGTPSATPSEPAIPSGFMKIATIDVPATATTILVGNITNNLNIDIKSLEKLQQASQAQAAFSDLLHSDGVYAGVLNMLGVSETSPQSSAVSVNTGVALKDGATARVSTATTVPIDAASFFPVVAENVTFNVDTKTLNTNGTPPHKIRAGTVVVTGKTEGVDFSINYAAGTITRLGGGSIAPGGTVSVSYDYYLPRIDRIELLIPNSTPQSITGTPAQVPVAPVASPNSITLAYVAVGEGVTTIVNANITDKRVYLPDLDEVVAARGAYASLLARFISDESASAIDVSNLSTHVGNNITSGNTVHGIKQGTGNGLDADMVDGIHAATVATANKLLALDNSSQLPSSADMVDGIHASVTPTANKLSPLDGSAKVVLSTVPQGPGSTLNADTVDGIHANATPTDGMLVPLGVGAKFAVAVIPSLPGALIQTVRNFGNTFQAISQPIPNDDTIPQNTEGVEIITVSITPQSTTSRLRVRCSVPVTRDTPASLLIAALFRDSMVDAVAVDAQWTDFQGIFCRLSITYEVVTGSISPTIFKLRAGLGAAGTAWVCGYSSARLFGGSWQYEISVDEIAA